MNDMEIDIEKWRQNIRLDVAVNYHWNMGLALLVDGSADAALNHFQKSIELAPDRGDVRWALSQAGGVEPAPPLRPAAIAAGRTALADAWLLRGMEPQAETLLREALSADDGCFAAHLALARILGRRGNAAASAAHARRAGEGNEDFRREAAALLYRAAAHFFSAGQVAAAEEPVAAAVALDATVPAYSELWAAILLNLTRYQDGYAVLEPVPIEALTVPGRFSLAALAERVGLPERGVAAARSALDGGYDPVLATLVLSNLLLLANDGGAALAAVDEALRRQPGHFLLTVQKAFLLGESKEPVQALECLGRAAAPDALHQALVDFRRGGILLRAGRLEDAEGAVRAAVNGEPRHPRTLRLLAAILDAQGRKTEAAALSSEAAGMHDPFDPARLLTWG